MDFQKTGMMLSRRFFEMNQKMANFMEQGENMLSTWLAGIDQNPLLAGKKFSVVVIAEVIDKFHLEANVFGHCSQRVFNSVFHLVLLRLCFWTWLSIIL